MKHATDKQIIAAAKTYGPIGCDWVLGMYAEVDGRRVYFGRMLYRDSLHNLARKGVLVANPGWTYSAA